MARCPSGGRIGDHHVSDGREADQGGDGQGRSAAPTAPTLRKVVCGHPLSTIALLGYIIIFESLKRLAQNRLTTLTDDSLPLRFLQHAPCHLCYDALAYA